VNAARRYPITMALIVLVLLSALDPLPSLIDAVTGSAATDAELVRPLGYVVVAPLSDVLDALTFLSLERAGALLAGWAAALALWGALRPGTLARRITRAVMAPLTLLALAVATLLLPRPVPRVVALDSAVTVMDYHAHTEASHDGRPGWTTLDLARWHAAQGFGASYVTDHNRVFEGRVEGPTSLLPGAEWSVYRQHILALGELTPIDRDLYNRDTPSLLGVFAELHRRGALAIGSIPEYWRSHWDDLDDFVKAGIDGFEIVNCAPKAIGFPDQARAWVVSLARQHNLLLIGGSDNHGWGKATCVWNLASPSAHGYEANHVLARPLALLQGQWKPWTAAYTQPWFMLRSLTWPERASWLTWILVVLIYRAVPRREGDPGGIGILARSLSLKILKLRRPTTTP
jgi:predicted metal-dependent phosphoesterase TrpH